MYEETLNIIENVPSVVVIAIIIGAIRSVLGWLENSYKDDVITYFEWKQLFGTMLKYFAGVMLLSQGLPMGEAIAGTFGLDVISSALKSTK